MVLRFFNKLQLTVAIINVAFEHYIYHCLIFIYIFYEAFVWITYKEPFSSQEWKQVQHLQHKSFTFIIHSVKRQKWMQWIPRYTISPRNECTLKKDLFCWIFWWSLCFLCACYVQNLFLHLRYALHRSMMKNFNSLYCILN